MLALYLKPIQVEKRRFKIGSLDTLMELNEALVKVDHTLENTVKKIEKIALEADLTKQQKAFVEHQNKKSNSIKD